MGIGSSPTGISFRYGLREASNRRASESYPYDDSGYRGGLGKDASYVLMGDMNADPGDAESLDAVNDFLLDNDDFGGEPLPTIPGGTDAGTETATFADGLTPDYVLPSPDLEVKESDVVWPVADAAEDELLADVETASDHRLVWADLAIED